MIKRYAARIVLEFLHCDQCGAEMQALTAGFYVCPQCNATVRDQTEYPKQTIVRGAEIEPVAVSTD